MDRPAGASTWGSQKPGGGETGRPIYDKSYFLHALPGLELA